MSEEEPVIEETRGFPGDEGDGTLVPASDALPSMESGGGEGMVAEGETEEELFQNSPEVATDTESSHASDRERRRWRSHYQRKYNSQKKKLKEWEARLMAKEQNLLVLQANYLGISSTERLRELNALKPSEYGDAQRILRNYAFKRHWKKKVLPMVQRRLKAVKPREMYDTESVYVQALITLRESFQKPMMKAGALTDEQAKRVFSNTADILEVQKPFLRALLERKKHHEDAKPLDVVLANFFNQSLMDAYVEYISEYDNNRDFIAELKAENAGFAARLASEESSGSTIGSFLIRPVQRLPRYRILLQEILKHTHKEHPARPALKAVMAKISATIKSIDRAKGRKDAVKRFETAMSNQSGMNSYKTTTRSGGESKLLVCVHSASGLKGSIGGADCFITVDVEGTVGRTQPKPSPSPTYEKDFAFYVTDTRGILQLKCYQNGVVPTRLGTVQVPLRVVARKFAKQDESQFELTPDDGEGGGAITLNFDWIPGEGEEEESSEESSSGSRKGRKGSSRIRSSESDQCLSGKGGRSPRSRTVSGRPAPHLSLTSSSSAESLVPTSLRARGSSTSLLSAKAKGRSAKGPKMEFPMLLTVKQDYTAKDSGLTVKKGVTVVATDYSDGRYFVSCDSVGAGWLAAKVLVPMSLPGTPGGGSSRLETSEEDSEFSEWGDMSETSEYQDDEGGGRGRQRATSHKSSQLKVGGGRREHSRDSQRSDYSESSDDDADGGSRTHRPGKKDKKKKKKGWFNTIKKSPAPGRSASARGDAGKKHSRRGSLEGPTGSADGPTLDSLFIPPAAVDGSKREKKGNKGKKAK